MDRQAGQQGEPVIEVHPADAARFGLDDTERVEATNESGKLVAKLVVTDTVVEGSAVLEGKWWWSRGGKGSAVANRLCQGRWTEAGQPVFNDIFVSLTPAAL